MLNTLDLEGTGCFARKWKVSKRFGESRKTPMPLTYPGIREFCKVKPPPFERTQGRGLLRA